MCFCQNDPISRTDPAERHSGRPDFINSERLAKSAAVAYVRMSSDKQEASPQQQRQEIERLTQRRGYRIIRWYSDEAVSGDATEKRLQFQQMIKDAEVSLRPSSPGTRTGLAGLTALKRDFDGEATPLAILEREAVWEADPEHL